MRTKHTKGEYHFIGWAGQIKYFSDLDEAIDVAKKEGVGNVAIWKGTTIAVKVEGFCYP